MTFGRGTKFWVGECRLAGVHRLSWRMEVVRLQIGSKKTPHLFGQEHSPKVSHMYRRMSSWVGSWVQHWIAVAAERLHHRKAEFKLILLALIQRPGYFLLAAMVQLISLHRHVSYMHGISSSLTILLLTDVPNLLHL